MNSTFDQAESLFSKLTDEFVKELRKTIKEDCFERFQTRALVASIIFGSEIGELIADMNQLKACSTGKSYAAGAAAAAFEASSRHLQVRIAVLAEENAIDIMDRIAGISSENSGVLSQKVFDCASVAMQAGKVMRILDEAR